MTIARFSRALVMIVPITLVACAAEPSDNAESSSNAITGSITAGATLETTSRLNLRERPGMDETIILTIPSGARVKALSSRSTNGFYEVSYNGENGWAYGTYLKVVGASNDDDDSDDANDQGGGGNFNGRSYSNVTMLWQGNWSFLVSCDSYSRSAGRVVFRCSETPSRSFVDSGAWIAVPGGYFSSGMCGKNARVCKGARCITAKVMEKSETSNKWEGSTAVLDALGVDSGFSSCTHSYGTATGVSVTME